MWAECQKEEQCVSSCILCSLPASLPFAKIRENIWNVKLLNTILFLPLTLLLFLSEVFSLFISTAGKRVFSKLAENLQASLLIMSGIEICLVLVHIIFIYITTQVILAFWLALAYDLLEDRRIDDNSTRFKFFWIFWILNLNQSQFFAMHSNQSVCFILYRH